MGPGRRMGGRVAQRIRPSLLLSTVALSAALVLSACGGGGDDGSVPAGPPVAAGTSCEALAGLQIAPAQIGLPTQGAVVDSATPVAAEAAGNSLGAHCRVRGSILPVDPQAPAIRFAVNLPETWNHKAIHFGGGGFNGTLIDGTEPLRFGPTGKPAPLALGYATFGDDGGHQSSSITDGSFAANDEALANYGGQSLKKTHDVAMLLVKTRYGAAPDKAYFLGTSTGGRDALMHIQRWPADYDGVVANEPALNYSGTRLSNVAVGRALYANGGAGWVNLAKTLLVQKTVLAACDKLDGAADGIVSNVESCRRLNPQILATLRCAGGSDAGDSCLSDAQLASIRTIESPLEFSGYTLAHGTARAGGYNILEGTLVAGPFTSRDLGTRAVPGNPATTADANVFVTGDQWAKYFVTRDAGFDTLTLDPVAPGAWAARIAAVSALTDALDPDLSPFLAHGGRLILLHGLADEVISNNSTIDYVARVKATVGDAAVEQGIRFYTVPGMGHGTGVFIPSWDSLAALENWVEQGVAPETGMVTDTVAATAGRTRPLCRFPAWPKYKGSGSLDAASNYSCVQETVDPLACPNLPGTATTYKGGDLFGEELSVSLDPATLAYTVTIDASGQRAAGTQRSGTLLARGNCVFSSNESGADFTFGTGGVLQGGVAAPTGTSFIGLVAFQTTFQNGATPAVFNPVANIFDVAGVQYGADGVASVYAASSRVRNAGTFQHCQDPASGRFMTYDAACTSTAKGYVSYNAARNAFDLYTTAATGGATTTGGTLSGSVIFGQVGASTVPLFLVRDPSGAHGLRLYAPQAPLAAGTADGRFALVASDGSAGEAVVSGTSLGLGGAAGTLAYDTPVLGVAQSSGAVAGNFVFNAGVMGFVSSGSGAVYQLGMRN
ncbi:tannase/feruloyl esterase family alpha/beta hydrolase [Rhizobacter sp. SG703]|uniref:tannase/feruloyl esterase family alpha/beta hydrolase n=1 Tax=Rhizobacter sp. SG703 TaxID=2587140 RepID=UPI00181467AD|nr:tannase/feruloyl esterase family alpha/beta hydrolase [Rhizobacter sp. SG703]NKI96377.1 feruloyl esterase [Rhizobacter sp. SG703]